MIDHIGSVSIFVSDQERAKRFYTEVLGFTLKHDARLPGSGARWIVVVPKTGRTEIALYKPDATFRHYQYVVGKPQALTFNVTDMKEVQARLLEKGVQFIHGPVTESWGVYAIIHDSEGNELMLVEQAARS